MGWSPIVPKSLGVATRPTPEMMLPEPIDQHAGRERLIRPEQPVGQCRAPTGRMGGGFRVGQLVLVSCAERRRKRGSRPRDPWHHTHPGAADKSAGADFDIGLVDPTRFSTTVAR